MTTRQKQNVNITNAESERLKRSVIPTMEIIPNKHHEDKGKKSRL